MRIFLVLWTAFWAAIAVGDARPPDGVFQRQLATFLATAGVLAFLAVLRKEPPA